MEGAATIQFGFLDLCAVAKAARVMHSRMADGIWYRAALHALRQLCTTESVMYAAEKRTATCRSGRKLGRARESEKPS